ncbi:MAG TPA: hypothetical protein VGM03_24195 [Phycisphaerae bacterium]
MVPRKQSAGWWVVVYVWRGIPANVEVFRGERAARQRERSLRRSLDLSDEVGVFEIDIRATQRTRGHA